MCLFVIQVTSRWFPGGMLFPHGSGEAVHTPLIQLKEEKKLLKNKHSKTCIQESVHHDLVKFIKKYIQIRSKIADWFRRI